MPVDTRGIARRGDLATGRESAESLTEGPGASWAVRCRIAGVLIVLDGDPGVGKLAIGRELAALVAGGLLDVDSVYNLAFALTEFKSPAF